MNCFWISFEGGVFCSSLTSNVSSHNKLDGAFVDAGKHEDDGDIGDMGSELIV